MTALPYDPEFPERPTHPDFARLAEAVQWLDTLSEGERFSPAGGLESYVDADSLMYLIAHRSLAALGRGFDPVEFAAYMEGFMLASRFAELGGNKLHRVACYPDPKHDGYWICDPSCPTIPRHL